MFTKELLILVMVLVIGLGIQTWRVSNAKEEIKELTNQKDRIDQQRKALEELSMTWESQYRSLAHQYQEERVAMLAQAGAQAAALARLAQAAQAAGQAAQQWQARYAQAMQTPACAALLSTPLSTCPELFGE